MGSLQGKGIWTLYDDIQIAVNKAPEVGAKYILCKVSKGGIYDPQAAGTALAIVRKNPKLVPLAWVYSYLRSPQDEANGLALALRDGFEAVILDAEADLVNKLKQAEELRQCRRWVSIHRGFTCAEIPAWTQKSIVFLMPCFLRYAGGDGCL